MCTSLMGTIPARHTHLHKLHTLCNCNVWIGSTGCTDGMSSNGVETLIAFELLSHTLISWPCFAFCSTLKVASCPNFKWLGKGAKRYWSLPNTHLRRPPLTILEVFLWFFCQKFDRYVWSSLFGRMIALNLPPSKMTNVRSQLSDRFHWQGVESWDKKRQFEGSGDQSVSSQSVSWSGREGRCPSTTSQEQVSLERWERRQMSKLKRF